MYFVWFQAEGLLLFLQQEPEVAARAALYLRYLSVGIPGYALNTVMKKCVIPYPCQIIVY
jgi:MATE family multidrug resistance protein